MKAIRFLAPIITGFIGGILSYPLFGGISENPFVVVPFLIVWSAVWAYIWTFVWREKDA